MVWQTHRETVEEELRDILGVEELDAKDPACFQQRNAAAKRVLEKMNEQEKAEMKAVTEEMRTRGNPEPVRRELVNPIPFPNVFLT